LPASQTLVRMTTEAMGRQQTWRRATKPCVRCWVIWMSKLGFWPRSRNCYMFWPSSGCHCAQPFPRAMHASTSIRDITSGVDNCEPSSGSGRLPLMWGSGQGRQRPLVQAGPADGGAAVLYVDAALQRRKCALGRDQLLWRWVRAQSVVTGRTQHASSGQHPHQQRSASSGQKHHAAGIDGKSLTEWLGRACRFIFLFWPLTYRPRTRRPSPR
jgi:hypothetical protein